MRIRVRAASLALLAAAALTLVACGGDDSQAERRTQDQQATATAAGGIGQASGSAAPSTAGGAAARATPAPANATGALQLDCGKDLKAFRFNGTLKLQGIGGGSGSTDPVAAVGSLLNDVRFSGSYVAPDRNQLKLEGGQNSLFGGGALEFVQIGNTAYTKIGNTGWQQGGADGALGLADSFDPRELCTSLQDSLRGDVPSRKEKVNGVDAIRYDYDKQTLERLNAGGVLGGLGGSELPDNFKMNVWVAEKEKFPVKIAATGSGQQASQRYALDLELNVTDLNGSVRIDAPR